MEASGGVLKRVLASAPRLGAADTRMLVLSGFALVGALALVVRPSLFGSGSALSPDASRSRKKRGKGRRKQDKIGDLEVAPHLERSAQTDYFEVRRNASTMTAETIEWFRKRVPVLLSPAQAAPAAAVDGKETSPSPIVGSDDEQAADSDSHPSAQPAADSVSVLSVGCGDGAIDIEVLKLIAAQPGVTKVHYVGIEPSASAAAAFRARLDAARQSKELGADVVAFVLDSELDDRPRTASKGDGAVRGFQSKHQFDLVLMVHVAHCFRQPYGAIQRAMMQTKPGGRVVVVQPKANGITQITQELTRDTRGSEQTVFNADDLKKMLQQHNKYTFDTHSFESQLDVTQCLNRTATGMKIMSDCMQRDLRKLKEGKVMRILKSFWRLAYVDPETGSAYIAEPAAVFVIDKPLKK